MSIIIWLVVGGLISWAANVFMGTNNQQGIVLNVVVGIVGAVLGGWLLSNFVGASTINQGDFSLSGLLVSFLGVVILLFGVKLLRRGRKDATAHPYGRMLETACWTGGLLLIVLYFGARSQGEIERGQAVSSFTLARSMAQAEAGGS